MQKDMKKHLTLIINECIDIIFEPTFEKYNEITGKYLFTKKTVEHPHIFIGLQPYQHYFDSKFKQLVFSLTDTTKNKIVGYIRVHETLYNLTFKSHIKEYIILNKNNHPIRCSFFDPLKRVTLYDPCDTDEAFHD